jgi:hypothetical protein
MQKLAHTKYKLHWNASTKDGKVRRCQHNKGGMYKRRGAKRKNKILPIENIEITLV